MNKIKHRKKIIKRTKKEKIKKCRNFTYNIGRIMPILYKLTRSLGFSFEKKWGQMMRQLINSF